jgi:copper homeostasis protein
MILEICANSYQSAINAEKAGAHRIELCSELAVGGITPSYGLLKKVMQDLTIPVHVLIRPRSGDFTYSDVEFDIMKENIQLCKELGCAGIVSGSLNLNNTIDYLKTKLLVQYSKGMSFTFHRAFDWLENPQDGLLKLSRIGVERVLTSGQELTAEHGLSLLTDLKDRTDVKIMPGGGINQDNVHLFQEAGFSEIHLSATQRKQTIEVPKISMNSLKHFEETQRSTSDVNTIQNILSKIND